jgi:hypothetical protein
VGTSRVVATAAFAGALVASGLVLAHGSDGESPAAALRQATSAVTTTSAPSLTTSPSPTRAFAAPAGRAARQQPVPRATAPSAPRRAVPPSVPAPPVTRAVPASPAAPGYSFLFPVTPVGPVRWNPCLPIHYVTNLAAAPLVRVDLLAAMAQLTAVTGIRFVFDGDTSERPSIARPIARNGAWAPVLIAVSDSDLLVSGDSGEGRALWWRTSSGLMELESGEVVLRPGSVPTRLLGFTDSNAAGPMLLHELGHVLGLGHTSAIGSIMNHDGASRGTRLSPGDLAGLRRLGSAAGCLADLSPPTG